MNKTFTILLVILLIAVATVLVVIFTRPNETTPKTTISVSQLYDKISQSVTLPNMSGNVNEDNLSMRYGIELTNVEEYIFVRATVSPKQDTIAIFKSDDAGTLSALKAAFEGIRTQAMNTMQNYEANEYEIASNGKIFIKGNYVVLVMSKDVTQITNIISENI